MACPPVCNAELVELELEERAWRLASARQYE
jgi:hypothetical protein